LSDLLAGVRVVECAVLLNFDTVGMLLGDLAERSGVEISVLAEVGMPDDDVDHCSTHAQAR
jgi:hypothetical protein